MLSTGATLNALVVFVCAGAVSGLFYDIFWVFKAITKHNIMVVNVIDLLCCLVCGLVFIYCIFKYEFGLFAVFEVVGFVFGLVFEQIIIKNLFTSPLKWVYNKVKLRKIKSDFVKE